MFPVQSLQRKSKNIRHCLLHTSNTLGLEFITDIDNEKSQLLSHSYSYLSFPIPTLWFSPPRAFPYFALSLSLLSLSPPDCFSQSCLCSLPHPPSIPPSLSLSLSLSLSISFSVSLPFSLFVQAWKRTHLLFWGVWPRYHVLASSSPRVLQFQNWSFLGQFCSRQRFLLCVQNRKVKGAHAAYSLMSVQSPPNTKSNYPHPLSSVIAWRDGFHSCWQCKNLMYSKQEVIYKLHAGWFIYRSPGEYVDWGLSIKFKVFSVEILQKEGKFKT